jgi:hypothetical protein
MLGPMNAPSLAELILAVHLLVIGFNVFGLVAVPLGAWRGWRFVRVRWWRVLHLVSLGLVALQALAGRACLLTIWQQDLTGTAHTPLIMGWINRVIFWPLPIWAFTVGYVAVAAYAVALFWIVPPQPGARAALR